MRIKMIRDFHHADDGILVDPCYPKENDEFDVLNIPIEIDSIPNDNTVSYQVELNGITWIIPHYMCEEI